MDRQSAASRSASDLGGTLSRRKIFKGAVGVAAAGAAGGSLLTEVVAPPAAEAATMGTTVESGAVAPAVVNLSDAATIAVDASLGNDFRVTINGNRTLGNPANPADGQKMVVQVTQGTGGNFTLSYGTAYETGAGLPAPTLSTTAGDTDLLAFIYNQAKAKWLLVAYVTGFASTTTPPPAGTYRLFASTNGPSSPVSYSGSFLAGIGFEVTSGGTWFEGFWWWVCPSGQSTSPQKFALWSVYNDGVGKLISGTVVTSGALTAGQWNYVPLSTPVPLAPAAYYNAATGFSGSFPDTNGQFGSGDPYSAGITPNNGPLTAFSDQSGSLQAPFGMPQGLFGVAGTDPSVNMPANGSNSANFWIDLQVGTTPPSGATYRLWPNYPVVPGAIEGSGIGYTLATEFRLSQSCSLDNIWFYSPGAAGALPTRCAIWNVSSQAVVSGTDNTSPSWTGAAGSGWVACAYNGVTLPAGDYKVAVFYAGGSEWFQVDTGYFGSGPGANGITAGPLSAPGLSGATSPGQGTYNQATWAYPDSYGSGSNGETFWVDVEVTPSS